MELKQDFYSDIPVHDIVLVFKTELASDVGNMHFDMDVDWGNMSVDVKYIGKINLTRKQVTFFILLSSVRKEATTISLLPAKSSQLLWTGSSLYTISSCCPEGS